MNVQHKYEVRRLEGLVCAAPQRHLLGASLREEGVDAGEDYTVEPVSVLRGLLSHHSGVRCQPGQP